MCGVMKARVRTRGDNPGSQPRRLANSLCNCWLWRLADNLSTISYGPLASRFYARALSLNPQAVHVWGYLRTAIACAGRIDLMDVVDGRDISAVSSALPLMP
eukprot:365099-Chlamydomonas_euryale.AAC.13